MPELERPLSEQEQQEWSALIARLTATPLTIEQQASVLLCLAWRTQERDEARIRANRLVGMLARAVGTPVGLPI